MESDFDVTIFGGLIEEWYYSSILRTVFGEQGRN
jgi:hypothetical protein